MLHVVEACCISWSVFGNIFYASWHIIEIEVLTTIGNLSLFMVDCQMWSLKFCQIAFNKTLFELAPTCELFANENKGVALMIKCRPYYACWLTASFLV